MTRRRPASSSARRSPERSSKRTPLLKRIVRRIFRTQPRRALIGEVRVHPRTGLWYVYEFHPDNTLRWLRYDTFVWGALARFPRPVADERDLLSIKRGTLVRPEDAPPFFPRMQGM